jgi:DNA-binding beta-propeller fold protein YncE
MKRIGIVLLIVIITGPAFAQQSVPQISYQSVPDFFKYPFEMNLGDMASVAVDSKGNIYMLSRSNVSGPAYAQMGAQILEFDKTGKFVREVAPRLYAWSFVHSIRIDKEDYIWVADKGSDMVVKINSNTGHVAMVFGRRAEASDDGGGAPRWHIQDRGTPKLPPPTDSDFRQPTDIAWDPQGNTFISDGYVNSRVAVFNKDGEPIRQFGEFGKGPGQFNNPHSIAVDVKGNVYVADRGNGRTQVFDNDGKFQREIRLQGIPIPPSIHVWNGRPDVGVNAPASPWSLCITSGPTQYLYIGDGYPGRVYKLTLDGIVLGMFGRSGRGPGQFGWVHGIACPSENELYIADENNWRVQKIILHPDKVKESEILRSAAQETADSRH